MDKRRRTQNFAFNYWIWYMSRTFLFRIKGVVVRLGSVIENLKKLADTEAGRDVIEKARGTVEGAHAKTVQPSLQNEKLIAETQNLYAKTEALRAEARLKNVEAFDKELTLLKKIAEAGVDIQGLELSQDDLGNMRLTIRKLKGMTCENIISKPENQSSDL